VEFRDAHSPLITSTFSFQRSALSCVGVFNRRLDEKFVGVLRQWSAAWKARHAASK
jgi:hypothetical protein